MAQDKLALAKQLASKINIKAVAGGKGQTQFTVATEVFLKGGEGAGQTMITAKSVADYLAAKLNARLNYTPSDEPMLVEDGGIFQKFEEQLETNDFPNRSEALAQISEYSEAGITVRGNNNSVKYVFIIIMYIISGTYYAPGNGVLDGERKLYLAIEKGRQHGLIGAGPEGGGSYSNRGR